MVQDSSEHLQATGGGGFGDAVGSGHDVVVVQDGTGTDVAGLREEHPLDQADLGELTGERVHSSDNPAGEFGGQRGGRAHGNGQDGSQSEFHGAQLDED